MILIDDREGSKHLPQFLPLGSCELVRMQFGDAAFLGKKGEEIATIGIELKTLTDALGSLVSGRLQGHQIPGMVQDYSVTYLIIEGQWTVNPKSGMLQHNRGRSREDIEVGMHRFFYEDIHGWLTTLEEEFGVRLRFTTSKSHTGRTIWSLYRWWQKSAHRGHLAESGRNHPLLWKNVSLLRKWAKDIEGIGWEKCKAIENHFGTCLNMALAEPKDWEEIDGVGKKISNRVVKEIREGKA